MTVTEPGRAEVLGWMARTGGGPAEAVDHFFPGISPEDKERMRSRFKQWSSRARRAEASPPPASSPQGSQTRAPAQALGIDMPDPPPNLAELDDEAYRVWQLEYLGAYLKACKRDVRQGAALLDQMSKARAELEGVRRRQGSTVKLEPTPAAVALDLAGEDKAIRLLVEAAEALKADADRSLEQQEKESP